MEHNLLKDLAIERDDWIIKVRVVRLWEAFTPQNEKEPLFLEMILLDEKETPLHVRARNNLISDFKHMLQEGHMYTIQNLKIAPANETYRPVKGKNMGWFLRTTRVTELLDHPQFIPRHYFEFASIQELSERVERKDILSDIIGTLDGFGHEEHVYVNGNPTRIRRLELILKENKKVKVTLWTTIADQFHNMWISRMDGTSIIAITSTLVKKFRDDYSINSTSSTRIYFDYDIAEYGNWAPNQHKKIKELPPQQNDSIENRMVRNRTNLRNIMAMKWEASTQEKVFTISATINDIDDTFGWNYIACHKCMKKLNQRGDQFTCPTCKEPAKYPTPRFKIQLEVSDETAAAKLTLFDRDAQQLLHTTASELLQHSSNKEIPPVVRNLCKQTLIFEIKLSDYNLKEGSQNYTITRTFIPTNFIEGQSTHKSVQKDPISPQQISSDEEEEPLVFKKKKRPTAAKTTECQSFDQEENNGPDDRTSADEEQILIQTLKATPSKRTKDSNTNAKRKTKRITRQKK